VNCRGHAGPASEAAFPACGPSIGQHGPVTVTGGGRPSRLRLLLDTNVVIAAEPYGGHLETNVSVAARLVRLANEQGHLMVVASATREDLLMGRDPARLKQRLVELEKFHQLEEVPLEEAFVQRAGASNPGSNDHRDLRILAALNSGAATHLISDDARLHRRAARASLGDAVLRLADAVELLSAFAPTEVTPPPRVEQIATYALNPEQEIFEGLRADYRGFDTWLSKVRRESDERACYIVADGDTYAALALLKAELDCTYGLAQPVLKVSTFKVASAYAGVKYGELLLKAVLKHAASARIATLYVEVLPTHPEVLEFLTDFGFKDSGRRTEREEIVMTKDRVPGPEADAFSDLEFHVRYGPAALRPRQSMYVVPIRPEYHDQLFPELTTAVFRTQQLSLFQPDNQPLTHPWGNALRKAYLCNSATTTIDPGDLLLFYRSRDRRAVTALGVVEAVLRSTQPEEVMTFVGRRTVYTPDEITRMCRSTRGVLAIRFRQDRFVEPAWGLTELRLAGVLKSWPQSINELGELGKTWVREQLAD